MTLRDRATAFALTFSRWPAAWPTIVTERGGREVLYATWLIGNDYRNKTKFYGSYPPGYLARVMALFPDAEGGPDCPRFDPDCQSRDGECHDGCEPAVLHAFSGSLPIGPYVRLDVRQPAELRCSVYDVADVADHPFSLVLADPPYSSADAVKYETAMVDRRRVLAALAQVTCVGGHLVWLDTVWPMHSKRDWVTVGRITIVRSTNHRVRLASIFERVAA